MREITYRDLIQTFQMLAIDSESPVIAHASLSAFGWIRGGAETIVGALVASFRGVIMPAFTYQTMVTPEIGPPNNALLYGSQADINRMAQIYHPDLPAHPLVGIIPETLRKHPMAKRSSHPILSFTGVNSSHALEAQTIAEPLAPIRILYEQAGWVLLIGTDHRTNTSIHLGEWLIERKGFLRWALTTNGVVECPGFPGCSDGFYAIERDLKYWGAVRTARLGSGEVQAVPLRILIPVIQNRLSANPLELLCDSPFCMRCQAVRDEARSIYLSPGSEFFSRSEIR